MLRFSANLSLLFTEAELPQRFGLAKQAGFQAVEIQFPYALPVEQLQQLLTEHELKLVLFNIDADDLLQGGEGLASVPHKRAQFQRALEQAYQYAQELKPLAINVLPGRCLNHSQTTDYLLIFKQNLRLATQTFSRLGIKTVFEAINTFDMPHFLIHSGQQMLNILQELALPDLFLQYDIYHLSRMGEDCAAFISQHAGKIGHIQFADCPGRGQPGSGEIDFKALFKLIAASNYQGWVGAEYKPSGATLDSLDWLKRL